MTDIYTPGERFYELLDKYNNGIEPLELWDTDDLLDLQEVIRAELSERDRLVQIEYFDGQTSYGGTDPSED